MAQLTRLYDLIICFRHVWHTWLLDQIILNVGATTLVVGTVVIIFRNADIKPRRQNLLAHVRICIFENHLVAGLLTQNYLKQYKWCIFFLGYTRKTNFCAFTLLPQPLERRYNIRSSQQLRLPNEGSKTETWVIRCRNWKRKFQNCCLLSSCSVTGQRPIHHPIFAAILWLALLLQRLSCYTNNLCMVANVPHYSKFIGLCW